MKRTITLTIALSVLLVFPSCSPKGWKMDYGKPAAQFHENDLSKLGQPFVGKKITVKGLVKSVDTSDSKSAWVILTGGTRCNLGNFTGMAESCELGKEVYVDGFLKKCTVDQVLIEPAMLRDPKAPFHPESAPEATWDHAPSGSASSSKTSGP